MFCRPGPVLSVCSACGRSSASPFSSGRRSPPLKHAANSSASCCRSHPRRLRKLSHQACPLCLPCQVEVFACLHDAVVSLCFVPPPSTCCHCMRCFLFGVEAGGCIDSDVSRFAWQGTPPVRERKQHGSSEAWASQRSERAAFRRTLYGCTPGSPRVPQALCSCHAMLRRTAPCCATLIPPGSCLS